MYESATVGYKQGLTFNAGYVDTTPTQHPLTLTDIQHYPSPHRANMKTEKNTLELTYQELVTGGTTTPHDFTYVKADALEKFTTLPYSFEIPSEVELRVSSRQTRSVNERLGNYNEGEPDRSGRRNMTSAEGAWKCWNLRHDRLGETVYLCSSTLSSFAGLLPNGESHTALCLPFGAKRLVGGASRLRAPCRPAMLVGIHYTRWRR